MMSFEAELPDRPEPRGVAGWLRFGAVVAGALATFIIFLFFGRLFGRPLDALAATWGLPHRMSLSMGLAVGTACFWAACIVREWSRPARRFLSTYGLPKSDR